jgi:hypothetical protein
MPVVGYLGGGSSGPNSSFLTAFRQGLSETGYVEGQSLAIEYRWAEGRYDRLPALAATSSVATSMRSQQSVPFLHKRRKPQPR